MIHHIDITTIELRAAIKKGAITMAGNKKLHIYGLLRCSRGKRMKKQNRVFFKTEQEAENLYYRPCGHCLPIQYRKWKTANRQHEL